MALPARAERSGSVNLDQVLLFALFGLGHGRADRGHRSRRRALLPRLRRHQPGDGGDRHAGGLLFWSLRTGIFGADSQRRRRSPSRSSSSSPSALRSSSWPSDRSRLRSPLAKLAASLGVLLTLQAAMLLSFGNAQKPQPSVLPSRADQDVGRHLPLDASVSRGSSSSPPLCWRPCIAGEFRSRDRAAWENEVAAVSRNRAETAVVGQHLSRLSRLGRLGVLAASVTALDSVTLPLQIVPALAARSSRASRISRSPALAGLLLGMAQSCFFYYLARQSCPDRPRGIALRGCGSSSFPRHRDRDVLARGELARHAAS